MPWIRMPVRRPVGAAPLAAAPLTAAPLAAAPEAAAPPSDPAVRGPGPGATGLVAVGGGLAVAGAAVVLPPAVVLADGAVRVAVVVLGAALGVMSGVAGYALRRLRASAARQREEQRDREQRAVLVERVRIARELHDVVAHHMSVIAVQAGLARYVLSSDPGTAERALHAVAEMSSEGLAEVRRLVTVLRPDLDRGGEQAPDRDTPGVDALPAMIERVGLTGVAIEFTVCGEQRPLPAGVELCVYRVVQESLTNAIKHARGARVTVLLRYEPDRVGVRIANDGRGGARPASPPRGRAVGPGSAAPGRGGNPGGVTAGRVIPGGVIPGGVIPGGSGLGPEGSGGKGLIGMYERAMLYGGTLTAGGLPQGGFEVVLTLPVQAAPDSTSAQDSTAAAESPSAPDSLAAPDSPPAPEPPGSPAGDCTPTELGARP